MNDPVDLRVYPVCGLDGRFDQLGRGRRAVAHQLGLCGGVEHGEVVGNSHGVEP